MDELTLNAYAKINLGLDVLRRREDGYHELKMIMQTVNLYDQLTFKLKEEPGIDFYVNLTSLPANDNNLVVKAAKLMMETFQIQQGIEIRLAKHIPVAAGLAGGSADAAATIKAFNELFSLSLSLQEMMDLGVKLGADIPYCLMQGTALSEGIGEVLTKLPPLANCTIIVVKPNVNVSTRYVYQNLVVNDSTVHPDIDAIISCIESQNIPGMCRLLGNVLETVTVPKHPKIESIKKTMLQMGAAGSLMSGSGPTVFGVFTNYKTAKRCYSYFKKGIYRNQTFLTFPYQP